MLTGGESGVSLCVLIPPVTTGRLKGKGSGELRSQFSSKATFSCFFFTCVTSPRSFLAVGFPLLSLTRGMVHGLKPVQLEFKPKALEPNLFLYLVSIAIASSFVIVLGKVVKIDH